LEALFTATSAATVTGLVVVDTATAWSRFGQAVILLLVQVGGLGIVTFSTFAALVAGRKLRLAQREIVVGSAAVLRRVDAFAVVKRIVGLTLLIEAAGAAALWGLWKGRWGAGPAAWHACFHAVAAFCNAGFSTIPGNLAAFRGDLGVNAVVMILIVLGGIGFVTFLDVEGCLRRRGRLALHTRIALATTGVLIVGGAVVFYGLESNHALRDLSPSERALASLFASVTARTAGFNTLDYATLTPAAIVLTMGLMFVGGSPAGCAGGVKTTSLAVLFAVARAAIAGRERPDLYRRSLPAGAVRQAQAVVLLAGAALLSATFLLEVAEAGSQSLRQSGSAPLELAFEATSALGTVGLSTGRTASLTPVGKLLLVVLMYAGRVGPLTIALTLMRRRRSEYHYAEEPVLVG
jgi:trk system potassium uptake protein TrkH